MVEWKKYSKAKKDDKRDNKCQQNDNFKSGWKHYQYVETSSYTTWAYIPGTT